MPGAGKRVQELRRRQLGAEQRLRLGAQLEQPADLRRRCGGDLLQRARDYDAPPSCAADRSNALN
jgi:hypothetical protein